MYDINSISDALLHQTMTVQLEYIDLSLLFFISVGLLQYHLHCTLVSFTSIFVM